MSFIESYNAFCRDNHSFVLPLFETARSLTLFLPGRFNESEVRSESLYCVINLLTLYHERLAQDSESWTPRGTFSSQILCLKDNLKTKTCKTILSILYYTEVLAEMIALRYGRKWSIVLGIESTKALARAVLLHHNNGIYISNTHSNV